MIVTALSGDAPSPALPRSTEGGGKEVADTRAGTPLSFLVRGLLWVLISAAFTSVVIQYSYAHGKLLCPPFYDDVSYFEDALHRLEKYYTGGALAVAADYRAWPPHSPFSSFVAATAFATLGLHDWAPYVANGIIILGLLVFLDYVSGGIGLWGKLALSLFALCVPISAEAVYEFRPDIASALCCATGATLLLWRPIVGTSWNYRVAAGALLGLALLFKPPTAPLTLALFVCTLGLVTVMELSHVLRKSAPLVLAQAWGQVVLPLVLIPLPHYLLTWRENWEYIKAPIFGSTHSIWQTPGTRAFHLLFYLTGPGGQLMLGRELRLLLAVIGCGLLLVVLLRRWDAMMRIGGLLVICAIAWAIPTRMDVKQPFFGTSFDWMLVFTAAYVLCLLLRMPPRVSAPAMIVVLAAAIALATFTSRPYNRGSPAVVARNRVVQGIYQSLRRELPQPYSRVYITSTGYVNAGVLDYYFRRDTLQALNIGENSYSGDVAMHARDMKTSDFVIASEQGNSEAWGSFIQSGQVQDQTLAAVRANSDFEQIESFPTQNEKRYFLFKRNRPFCGWEDPRGLSEASASERGELRFACWGVGNSTKLTIPADGYPKLRLVARARSLVDGLSIVLEVDGKRRGKWELHDTEHFQDLTHPFTIVGGGAHAVELIYSPTIDNGSKRVLFSELEIIPDELK